MIAVLARVLARYLAGALVLAGLLPQALADQIAIDPDIALLLGVSLGLLAEGFHALARRQGWSL